jgi:hypothetical protein
MVLGTLSMPALASVDAERAICYLSELEVSSEPSPLKHGIRLEVVCAHASREVVGVDRENSELSLLDGEQDLLAAGRQWMDQYKRDHPARLFFSTRSFNDIDFRKPDGRVLPIEVHSSALAEGSALHLRGAVSLYIAGSETQTVRTTAGALREEEPIALSVQGAAPMVPLAAGWSNDSPMIRLTGGAALAGLVSAPEGVRVTNFSGARLLVVGKDVPEDAPIHLRVRISERVQLPVSIRVPAD